jgi:hypothetical protein
MRHRGKSGNYGMTDTLGAAYAGKRVFVTGHTGFKGAWLTRWLLQLGAEVHGFSLPAPVSSPYLFGILGLTNWSSPTELVHRYS